MQAVFNGLCVPWEKGNRGNELYKTTLAFFPKDIFPADRAEERREPKQRQRSYWADKAEAQICAAQEAEM